MNRFGTESAPIDRRELSFGDGSQSTREAGSPDHPRRSPWAIGGSWVIRHSGALAAIVPAEAPAVGLMDIWVYG